MIGRTESSTIWRIKKIKLPHSIKKIKEELIMAEKELADRILIDDLNINANGLLELYRKHRASKSDVRDLFVNSSNLNPSAAKATINMAKEDKNHLKEYKRLFLTKVWLLLSDAGNNHSDLYSGPIGDALFDSYIKNYPGARIDFLSRKSEPYKPVSVSIPRGCKKIKIRYRKGYFFGEASIHLTDLDI